MNAYYLINKYIYDLKQMIIKFMFLLSNIM